MAVKVQTPRPPEFDLIDDYDYTSPYPCGVCKQEFRSRRELATHPHPKRKVRK